MRLLCAFISCRGKIKRIINRNVSVKHLDTFQKKSARGRSNSKFSSCATYAGHPKSASCWVLDIPRSTFPAISDRRTGTVSSEPSLADLRQPMGRLTNRNHPLHTPGASRPSFARPVGQTTWQEPAPAGPPTRDPNWASLQASNIFPWRDTLRHCTLPATNYQCGSHYGASV